MSVNHLNFDFDQMKEYDHSSGFIEYGDMGSRNEDNSNVGRLGGMPTSNEQRFMDDVPMFTLEQVDYKPKGIQQMLVCSNRIIIATQYSRIIRLDLNNPSDLEEIEFTRRPEERIYKIFLDPTGHHLIISMETEEVYYIHSTWKKPKLQAKWRVNLIESIAWDAADVTPQTILIGNNKGKIWETTISSIEKGIFEKLDFSQKEPMLKQLRLATYAVCLCLKLYFSDDGSPISGMRLERAQNRYFAIITTPSRIFQLIGGPTIENLFQPDNIRFDELPTSLSYSELAFYAKSSISLPTSFAWMIGSGIYHGDLIFGSQNPGDKFTTAISILDFTRKDHRGNPLPPLAFALTQFHFLFLYEDKLQAIGKLNGQIVYEYSFNPKQIRLKGLCVDSANGTTWVYAENIVFELCIRDEDRNAWKLYLERGQFETALEYAKEPYASDKKDMIWATQADYYFKENKFELAANFYGKTHKIFEEITLKFINANQRDALKSYLLQKLQNIPRRDTTQKTIICTWLTEIFIAKLNTLRTTPGQQGNYQKIQGDFRQFINSYKDCLNQATTFHIISSHGAIDELLYYAELIEDYERVISYHIQHQAYDVALNKLTTLKSTHQDLYYKFCPVLFHFIPYQTVNVWMQSPFLNPRKLIPSLMRYDQSRAGRPENQAIRYLRYCVQNHNQDRAVHNYLLSLYVKQDDDSQLLTFLQSPDVYYDLKYALRLCMKEHKLKACVIIYGSMGLYEEAVDLALTVDISLAKENADKLKDEDEALCKKLWLRIARHVVEKDNNIKEAMEFLQHCPLLKIEDILPFFPDFTVIDDFKEEICKSLEDYNQYIEELKNEMDDATSSADLIRKDIQNLRNKFGVVRGDQKCDICSYPVLTKRFYLFSCQHVFHSECLISEIMRHLDSHTRQKVRELQVIVDSGGGMSTKQQQQPNNNNQSNQHNIGNSSNMMIMGDEMSQEESIKNELDRIVAKECLYCGDIMIRSIEKPFIAEDEVDVIRSWEI
ncbi:7-fold repeat in clathrin and VPS proteins repeat-containing protein [Heterostelium album PN500]|uniref:7-fold repeat in clathrin and VPS proteins repeat-containing protein n=1 Tax=Heterostelium pallidum (strain ATCC 26659 / Pp 5 / PN500) TaxID=670386 RepID=D3BPC0_HETP5|nr:7-fold repeat in clathrin and VPS proteins repeat-containing protein [Heterostelium album PN500]EFA77130.1 7-fold repeat in clathrin and VPS proteins repeat-containing protein [Heterostelium album PN500]|eukprot:XP_020429259.1 7-fold repeat in clathrin and VPS proteins repeat-containing protein [Heterostelium album PN500]